MSMPASTPPPVAPSAGNPPAAPAAPAAEAPKGDPAKPETSKSPEPAKEPPRKFKVVTDGEEEELDEPELIRRAQRGKSADKKYQEAAATRKQFEGFVAKIKADPIKGMQALLAHPQIGHDLRKLATDYLAAEFEREAMSPEQRELHETKQKLKEYEEEKRAAAEAQVEAEASEFRKSYAGRVEKEILEAIQPSGLPVTEFVFGRVTYYLRESLRRGLDLTAADVVPLVRADYDREIKSLLGGLDGQVLADMLGGDTLEKIRKRDLEEYKKASQPAAPVPAAEEAEDDEDGAPEGRRKRAKAPAKPKPRLTYAQAADKIRAKFAKG